MSGLSKIVIFGLLIVAALLIVGYFVFSGSFGAISGEPGWLQGRVTAGGSPSASYEVEVFREDGKTLETRTVSNKDGSYFVLLPAGSYVVYVGKNKEERRVEIFPKKATNLDLIVE